MCQGLYPTLVKEIIDELRIYSTLVPNYTTNHNLLPYDVQDESFCELRESITGSIQNNPVLSSWYFSWNTCAKISQLDIWKKKKLLFLGTPRLFEFFASHRYGDSKTLVDLDSTVINALSAKYKSYSENIFFLAKDIGTMDLDNCASLIPCSYDYVFFDPPWYPDEYSTWLKIALKYVKSTGSIVFSLFPSLLRPTAVEERKQILDKCREVADKIYLCSGQLEYDVPTFENNELKLEGINLRSNWKTSDMIIVSGMQEQKNYNFTYQSSGYAAWQEFWWLDARWFLDTTRSFSTDRQLISAPLETLFLKNPSRRNIQLKEVNLLSSKGHGLRISDPIRFLNLLEQLHVTTNSSNLYNSICSLDIDEASKQILIELAEDF